MESKPTNKDYPDIAICTYCGWRGSVKYCDTDFESDENHGYYAVDICPKCMEVIEEYTYTVYNKAFGGANGNFNPEDEY